MDAPAYDYAIVGAGMGGLSVAALLAHGGARVALVEAHEHLGGYCHTFPMGPDYKFCAAVHYIFSCGEGEPIHNLLKKIGLHEAITFERLDPDGYDVFSCPTAGLRSRIPNGLARWRDRLCAELPEDAANLRAFFDVVLVLAREIDRVPDPLTVASVLRVLLTGPQVVQVLRYRHHTLQRLFDEHRLSSRAQAILATQVGDLGLPPADVSLLIWCALVARYGRGAYYPTEHFSALIDGLARTVRDAPGCAVMTETEIVDVRVERDRVTAVVTADGRTLRAERFIWNADPRLLVERIGRARFPASFLAQVETEYSASSVSLYLGVRDLDLRAHGFGNWNTWHYPRLDINDVYRAQHERDDLSDPWLFLSTPTLCSPRATTRHAPEGHQILEVITTCAFEPFDALKREGLAAYTARKNAVRDRMIDIVEQHYVPGLRAHLAMKVAGTPTTNLHYVRAPRGAIYGSALTPRHVDANRLGPRTPIENLFLVGASASFPSIGGTAGGANRLYTLLTGDRVDA